MICSQSLKSPNVSKALTRQKTHPVSKLTGYRIFCFFFSLDYFSLTYALYILLLQ